MREEVFKLHVAISTYDTHTMSVYKTRQETISTGSSFPAAGQHGLLSLLVLYSVFFPCWCFTNFVL